MSESVKNSSSILQKMVKKDTVETKNTQSPSHRAFNLAIAQVADDSFSLELDVVGIKDTLMDKAQATSLQMENALYFSVSGPNRGPGLVVVSAPLITALIEVQTTGIVSPNPGEERPPTATDAAIIQPFVAAVLTEFGKSLEGVDGEQWTSQQAIKEPVFDLHRLTIDLPEIKYRSLTATIGLGARSIESAIVLILPKAPIAAKDTTLGPQTVSASQKWQKSLRSSVHSTETELSAILTREDHPLSFVKALTAGMLIPIPLGAEHAIRVEGIDRGAVAVGKIGMMGSNKAIRLTAVGTKLTPTQVIIENGANETMSPEYDLTSLGIIESPSAGQEETEGQSEPNLTEYDPNQTPARDIDPVAEQEVGGDGAEEWGIPNAHGDLPELDLANDA